MKKVLITIFAVLLVSTPTLRAQIGFDFGMNYEFLNRKAPDGFKSGGFGMGPYAGIIYGIPVSMSSMVNVGLNYKYDILWGAPGAWDDDTKLCPVSLGNFDTDIHEQHVQMPVTFNRQSGFFNFCVGPVFDYCLSSKISSSNISWPKDANGSKQKLDCLKDYGVKPFNIYLKAGAGFGTKGFSFKLTAAYGLLDLSSDGSGLRRWTVGMDFHLNL